eukprot:PhF_6_TR41645/c4_g1_i3/m.63128
MVAAALQRMLDTLKANITCWKLSTSHVALVFDEMGSSPLFVQGMCDSLGAVQDLTRYNLKLHKDSKVFITVIGSGAERAGLQSGTSMDTLRIVRMENIDWVKMISNLASLRGS